MINQQMQENGSNFDVGDTTKDNKATTGLVLGIIGLVAWFIPIIGAPITIIGLTFGIKGLKSSERGVAIAGIVLSSVGLFATIVNSSTGIYQGMSSGEIEGVINFNYRSNCGQIITIQDHSWQTHFKKFTCSYIKTNSGKMMGGECVNIESSNNSCATAYVYEKKQDNICTDPKYPYLGYDDMCYTTIRHY